jgi:lipopolysaccharide transport system permease protein
VGLTIVFIFLTTRVAKVADTGDIEPPLFFFAGTCLWTFFTSSVANAGNSVVGSEKMITKIYFPRLSIPLAAVGAAVVDFVISFCLLLALCAWYHRMPGAMILLMPAIFATVMMLALGVGSLLAALNVSYRDFRYVIPFLIQIWMFATPTIYSTWGSTATGWKHLVQAVNPMTPLVAAFRAACLGGPIDWPTVGAAVGMSLLALLLGCAWFRRTEHTFADRI